MQAHSISRKTKPIPIRAEAKPRVDGACLVVIDGPKLGKCIHVHDVPVIIGRAPEADFQVDNPTVSLLHCTVWHNDAEVYLRDLDSKNGTLLNGNPVKIAELNSGDQIALGETVLKFVPDGSVEANYHEAMYELATMDSLTQLHNRRSIREMVEEAAKQAQMDGGALSLAIFDLDHFKQVNDVLGHQMGDEVLRKLASALSQGLRPGDAGGRLGGDEFVVLMRDASSALALEWCEGLRQSMEGISRSLSNLPSPITVSIGVATWAPALKGGADLLRASDMALLRAKRAGRNTVCTIDTKRRIARNGSHIDAHPGNGL